MPKNKRQRKKALNIPQGKAPLFPENSLIFSDDIEDELETLAHEMGSEIPPEEPKDPLDSELEELDNKSEDEIRRESEEELDIQDDIKDDDVESDEVDLDTALDNLQKVIDLENAQTLNENINSINQENVVETVKSDTQPPIDDINAVSD